MHPHGHRAHVGADQGWSLLFGHEHLAAAQVDLVLKLHRQALGCMRELQLAVIGDQRPYPGCAPAGQGADLQPGSQHATLNTTGKAAEVRVGPHHKLHGKAQRSRTPFGNPQRHGFKGVQQRRARIPGHVGARVHDIVAGQRADRDQLNGLEPQPVRQGKKLRPYRRKHLRAVADEIHLVYRCHDVRDLQQACDVGVPARLRQQAPGLYKCIRIDEHDGHIGRRRACRHVARVLLVPGRVRDDEFALRCREVTIGNIDGDALLALGSQTIRQQRKVDGPIARAIHAAGADAGKLILVDALGVVEQTPNQRALAVVDRPGRGEAQQFLIEMRVQKGSEAFLTRCIRWGGIQVQFGELHQKYPSRFFISMDPSSS